MKISKTIARALILLSIGLFSLPSCKEKRGCTDSASANYDPEATLYEYGSCDYSTSPSNIYGNYQGHYNYSSYNCSNYNNQYVSITVSEYSNNYIRISGMPNAYSLEFMTNGNSISTGHKAITSSYPYTEVIGGNGTFNGNTLNFEVYIYDYDCGDQTYSYTVSQ